MAYNYDDFNGDALIYKYNIDSNGNPISIAVDREEKRVSQHSSIQLEFIPDEMYRVEMLGENNSQMYEVFNKEDINENSFYIDYKNGVAYVDKSQIGNLKVYNYYNKGLQLIGCSRIYDEHDVRGKNVMLTLQEIIDAGKECIRILLDIGDAYHIITRLEKDIKDGGILHENLLDDIAIGTPLQLKLHADIVEAKKWKDQLHEDVEEGKVLQPLLHNDIIQGNLTKQELDESILNAQDDINTINANGNDIKYITTDKWTLNSDSGLYEYTLPHTMNSKALTINCYYTDTDEFAFIGGKILDKNNILFKNEEAVNLTVVLNSRYYKPQVTLTSEIAEEVVEARKGKVDLKTKIDEIDEQLETIAYDFSKLKGDGITDETNLLQEVFNNLKEHSVISFPKGKKYKISKPITINTDNVRISGNKCEMVWANETNSFNDTTIRETWNGFFNVHGVETLIKTTITGYNTNVEPVINGRWRVENSANFKENDYVYINIKGGYEVANFIDGYNPSYMVLAKVVKVESGYITTDYFTPFYMDTFNWELRPCEMIKVTTRNNITIEDFILNDIVPWENFTSNDGRDRDKVACGIGVDYASNIVIKNIKGKRNKFPTIMVNRTHNFTVDNVEGIDPSYVGPAEGYSVKINRSCFGDVSNVYGKNGRHVIDFSWSAFVDVKNCYNVSKNYQSNGGNGAFDLHGICEHNIKFYNCNGDFVFGNGFASFPMLMKDITIDKCRGKGSFYNTENLLVTNSDIVLSNGGEDSESGNISVKFVNCNIKYGRSYEFRGRKRGIGLKTSLIINNSNVEEYVPATGSTWINNISDFDVIKIKDNDIDFSKTSQLIKFVNSHNIDFSSNRTKGLFTQYELAKDNYFNYNVNYNEFLYTDTDLIVSDTTEIDIVRILRITNSIGDIIVNNNVVRTNQTRVLTVLDTNIPDEEPKNNNIKVFFENNKILPSKNNNTKLLLPTKQGVTVFSNNNFLDKKIINYNELIIQQLAYYNTAYEYMLGKNLRISKDNALLLLEDLNNNGFQIRNTNDTLTVINIVAGAFGNNLFEIARNGSYTRIKTKALKLPVITSSEEPGAEQGSLYYDYSTKKFRKCIDGINWVDANI